MVLYAVFYKHLVLSLEPFQQQTPKLKNQKVNLYYTLLEIKQKIVIQLVEPKILPVDIAHQTKTLSANLAF